jgi:hypothetical protein
VSEIRTIEIPAKWLITIAVALILIGAVVVVYITRDAWTQMFMGETVDKNKVSTTETVIFIPQAGKSIGSEAVLAERVARAYYTIDYRDPQAWLNQLEPYATNTAFELLRTVFAPMSFTLFEKDELIIQTQQVTAVDRGVLKQGPTWQIRLVEVHIDNHPVSMPVADLEMRLLLVMENGDWKLQATLTEAEVESFAGEGEGT